MLDQDKTLQFLTVDEVAMALKISTMSVGKYIKEGKLKTCHIGRLLRIRRSDFENFVNQQN